MNLWSRIRPIFEIDDPGTLPGVSIRGLTFTPDDGVTPDQTRPFAEVSSEALAARAGAGPAGGA